MPDASNAMSSLEMSELEAQVVQDAKPGTARVTLDDIKAQVMAEEYFRSFATLTICVLKLKNGFTVTGESACADVALFDAELGKKFAREDAMRKIWPLEAYFLRAKLHEAGL